MTVDNFIPELWSSKYLTRLRKEMVYGMCLNRDYEGEIKNQGDTVRVNTVGPVTISNYTKNTINLTPEVINGAGESMIIDQANYFYFAIDDVDGAQAQGGIMEGATDEAAYGMKDTVDQWVAALIAAGVAPANTIEIGGTDTSTSNPLLVGSGAGDADAYEVLVELGTILNKANVPSGGRWVVVDPDFVACLLKDPRFSSFATALSQSIMAAGTSAGPENGNLPAFFKSLLGFDMKVSNNVPTSGSVKTILAGYKGAVSFAEQIASGSPEAFRLQTGFADAVRGLQLYGGKVFRPSGLARVYVQYS